MKALVSFLLLIFLLSENSFAVFDNGLLAKAKGLTSKHYVIDGEEISTAVQTLNFLGHQLQKTDNADTARNLAETIIGIASSGQGVGGLRARAHRHHLMNRPEKELTISALTKAVEYLQLKGLFDEASLSDRILEMLGKIGSEESAKKHAAIVSSLMYGAHAKAAGIEDFIVVKPEWVSRLPDSIRGFLADDAHWRDVTDYMPRDLQEYNEIKWKSVIDESKAEYAVDKIAYPSSSPIIDYASKITVPADLMSPEAEALIDSLEKTYFPVKAMALTIALQSCLKRAPLKSMRALEHNRAIRAIIAIEKFRLLEVTAGGFDKMDPTALEYKDDSQDPEDQAILMALVSTIDNYLYNPNSTLDDLKRRFNYQTNDSLWPEVVRVAAKALPVDEIINRELIDAINATEVAINERQRIVLDQLLTKQQLIFQGVPEFDFASGTFRVSHRFLHFIKSCGDGQCGYYSLRYLNGKREYTKKIADNLTDPEIRRLAAQLTGVGINLFLKLRDGQIVSDNPEVARIVEQIKRIRAEQDREKEIRWPGNVTDAVAGEVREFVDQYERLREPLYDQLVSLVGPSTKELREIVLAEINRVDYGGYLGMNSTADWTDQKFSFSLATSFLNNDDIYVWIDTDNKKHHQGITYENGDTSLVTFVSALPLAPGSQPRRIHMYNTDGEYHYDKWVEADNHPDLAHALRHKNLKGLSDTSS